MFQKNERIETGLNYLSDTDLFLRFDDEQWNALTEVDRLATYQELENRYSAMQGRKAARIVDKKMGHFEHGYNDGEVIYINSQHLQGNDMRHRKEFSSVVGMETILREGYHLVQNEICEGNSELNVEVPTDMKVLWMSNQELNKKDGSETKLKISNQEAARVIKIFEPLERAARAYAAQEIKKIYGFLFASTGRKSDTYLHGMGAMWASRVEESHDGERQVDFLSDLIFLQQYIDELDAILKENDALRLEIEERGTPYWTIVYDYFSQITSVLNRKGKFLDGLDEQYYDHFALPSRFFFAENACTVKEAPDVLREMSWRER